MSDRRQQTYRAPKGSDRCRVRQIHLPAPLVFVLGALFLGSAAGAQTIGLRSDTLVSASGVRPALGASDTRSQVPIYELLGVTLDDVGVAGLRVEFSGFAGAQVADPPLVDPTQERSRVLGNVTVGLLRWRHPKRGIASPG